MSGVDPQHAPPALPAPTRFNPQRLIALALVGAGALVLMAPFYFTFVFATHVPPTPAATSSTPPRRCGLAGTCWTTSACCWAGCRFGAIWG